MLHRGRRSHHRHRRVQVSLEGPWVGAEQPRPSREIGGGGYSAPQIIPLFSGGSRARLRADFDDLRCFGGTFAPAGGIPRAKLAPGGPPGDQCAAPRSRLTARQCGGRASTARPPRSPMATCGRSGHAPAAVCGVRALLVCEPRRSCGLGRPCSRPRATTGEFRAAVYKHGRAYNGLARCYLLG